MHLCVQVTKPLIDPVTHKKIVFVDASDRDTMAVHFYLDSLEQCMGGSLTSDEVFNLNKYRDEMTREDAEQDAKLGHAQTAKA